MVTYIAGLALAGAFFAEWMGVSPCKLCWYQRGIFALLIVSDSMRWRKFSRIIAIFGLAFSIYHIGVEQSWWQHKGCVDSGPPVQLAGLSEDEKYNILKQQVEQPMIPSCDQAIWYIFGLPATLWTIFVYLLINGVLWYGYPKYASRKSRR